MPFLASQLPHQFLFAPVKAHPCPHLGSAQNLPDLPVALMMNFEEKAAHATAILIIAPVSLAGAAAYIISGYALPYIIIPAAVGMTAGGAFGAQLLNKLPLMAVKVIFVAVMLAAGIRMILP